MKFHVKGIREDNGEIVDETIDATDEASAAALLRRNGIFATRITSAKSFTMSGEAKAALRVLMIIVMCVALAVLIKSELLLMKISRDNSSKLTNENTEDKLRRVYDSQGIDYDSEMIRDDAKAIDELHREFGR